MNLDRFAQGLPDLQEQEPEVIATCACGCGAEIVEGYEYIFQNPFWFFDTECFLKFHQAEWKIVEQLEQRGVSRIEK